jgi:hypothetical protein
MIVMGRRGCHPDDDEDEEEAMVARSEAAVMTVTEMPRLAGYWSVRPAVARVARHSTAAAIAFRYDMRERLLRAREAAAIEAEDILTQAEEAGGLDPVG